jgi:hypothetical protein
MLARVVAAVVLSVTAQQVLAVARPQIVGSWRSDDGRGYAEAHFRADHTFTLFTRMGMKNPTLAVARMNEQFGTWHLAGDRVVLDSTERGSKKRSRITLKFTAGEHSLKMQRLWDASGRDRYRRMTFPRCAETRLATDKLPDERGLVGRWRGHYRTHDTEFAFESGRRVTLYSWDLGNRFKFSEATWRLRKNTIRIKPTKDDLDEITWHVIRAGKCCLVINDGSEMSYTLQRVR